MTITDANEGDYMSALSDVNAAVRAGQDLWLGMGTTKISQDSDADIYYLQRAGQRAADRSHDPPVEDPAVCARRRCCPRHPCLRLWSREGYQAVQKAEERVSITTVPQQGEPFSMVSLFKVRSPVPLQKKKETRYIVSFLLYIENHSLDEWFKRA